MIEQLTYVETGNTDPYENLAVEEYLLLHCRKNECILYLWQNQNTIVAGRNQNVWRECLVSRLEQDKGYIARRLSGGGAVYHDLGNLNFTFLVRKENYDVSKQLDVILKAVRKLGVAAEKSGRNDILVDGRKFSGNAFYEKGDYCYHHGTLMVNVNMADLSKYLTVSKEKLQSKGVVSVQSRVVNLSEYVPDLSVDIVKEKLREAFEEVYGLSSEVCDIKSLDEKEIKERTKHFASWDWIFGKKLDFQYELSHRFNWGEVVLQVKVKDGRIEETNVYSDTMKPDLVFAMEKYLRNVRYNKNAICAELWLYWSEDREEDRMMKEIIEWIKTVDL